MNYLAMMIPGMIMIILGLAIRAFALNSLPKITFVIIWTLVCVRLLFPYVMPLISIPLSPIQTAVQTTNTVGIQMFNETAELQFVVIEHPAATTNVLPTILTAIWIAGAIVVALYFMFNHIKFRRMVRDSIPVREDFVFDWQHKISRPVKIHSSDKISSPLTYGVVWPVILLPSTMNWQNEAKLQYILSHEYVHIRRFDCVLKLLFALTLCVYWFNPLVWVMFVLANRDIELSCDEAILNEYGRQAKIDYAMTLLDMMEDSEQHAACNFANLNKNAIDERFKILAASKRTSVLGSIAAVALIALPMLLFVGVATYRQSNVVHVTSLEQSVWITENFVPNTSDIRIYQSEWPIINEAWVGEFNDFSLIIPNLPEVLSGEQEVTITTILP